jgi:P27 family predicted phage terminase small subunit
MKPSRWLDATAKTEWRRLAPELVRLGLLTVLDVAKFEAYCRWYSRWRRYEGQLTALWRRRDGELSKAKSGYVQQHPLVAMARSAAEMMNRFGSQFGLSGADRASISLPLDPTAPQHDRPNDPPPTKPRDEFDDFLKRSRRHDPTA